MLEFASLSLFNFLKAEIRQNKKKIFLIVLNCLDAREKNEQQQPNRQKSMKKFVF